MRTCSGEDGMRGAYSGREPGGIEMKTKMNLARGGGASASKKLLAAIAVLAVAFVVFAAIPAVDADNSTAEATPVVVDGINKLTGNVAGEYKLAKDFEITNSIGISAAITLDLNGFTLKGQNCDTITVFSSGMLTIVDNSDKKTGIVDVVGDGKAAIKNEGTVVLNGGTIERSQETGIEIDGVTPTKKDSYYTVKNDGTLTVNDGTTIRNFVPGTGIDASKISGASSNICNGGDKNATLTINGGTIDGGLNAVKNDFYGVLTIKNGTITNQIQVAVMNWGEATIDGGSFTGYQSALWVCSWYDKGSSTASAGKLTVNGGTFTNGSGWPDLIIQTNSIYGAAYEDQPVEVNLNKSISIGCNNTKATITLENKGVTVEFKDNSKLPMTISYDGSSASFNGMVAKNGVKISAGSVEIEGDFVKDGAGSITVTGDAKITGDSSLGAGVTLTVSEGATLTVKAGVKLTAVDTTASVKNNGTIITEAGADIAGVTISGSGEITNNADDSEMSEVTVGGISDAGTTVFTAKNIVIVNKSWTLINGSDVTINGKLVIPEGATLTIQSGAKLTLDNNAVFEIEGTLVIEEAEEVAPTTTWGLIVKMGEVRISNNVTVNGPVDVQANGKLIIGQDGALIIGTEGSLTTHDGSKVTVDASGTLQVNGQFDGATVYNKGTVIIDTDKAATADTTVIQGADGAVVDVVKYTVQGGSSAKLTVKDDGMVFTTYRNGSSSVNVTIGTNNSVEIAPVVSITAATGSEEDSVAANYNVAVSGLKVVSGVSTEATTATGNDGENGVYNQKQYSKTLDVAGAVSVSAAYAGEGTAASTITSTAIVKFNSAKDVDDKGKSSIAVSGALELQSGVTVDNANGTLAVTGTVVAQAGAEYKNTTSGTASGAAKVTGEGEISNVKALTSVTATEYVTKVKDSTGKEVSTYHYVNIDKALAVINAEGSAVKEITLQDAQTVKTSSKVPADKTLNLNGKKLTIDAKDNVTLTVVNGAVVKGAAGSSIDVKGTLFAENKNNVKSGITIASDVYSEEVDENGKAVKNGWAKWTNLTTALNEAKPGQKIVLKDEVTLETNTTVPEGVTLEAGDKKIKIADGVTLTVDGILTTNADILAQSAFATTAQKVTAGTEAYSSAVVVNGKLVSSTKITYAYTEASHVSKTSTTGAYTAKLTEKSVVAGAYYEQDSNYVISSLKVAQAEFSTIQFKIVINGAVTAGDLAFTATEGCSEIEVAAAVNNGLTGDNKTIDTVLTVSSMTLSGMTLTVNGKITGAVAVGDAAIDAKLVSGIVVESDESKLTVSGSTSSPTIALGKGASLTVSKGTVYAANVTINNNSDKTYVTVASGATLEIAGTVSVDYIAVAGILNVPSGKEMTVDVQIDVTGVVTVAPATDSTLAGKFIVNGVLYLGISSKDLKTGAAASFSGPVTVNIGKKLVVAADASVDDAFKASVKDCKSTEFYVNGALWFTAYANGTATITVDKIPVADVKLDGWSKTDGGEAVAATEFTYTIGIPTKLYAVIITEVYDIVIKADEGIANVYLDGQLMTYGSVAVLDGDTATAYYYAYTATVAAGDHKVTYTLQNGWSGEATLYLNGTAVSGNTIKASGDFSKDLVFTLSGVQKSGYVDPTPAPSTDDKDDGLTITDYLLIVLVVLIVILAVIVAMRLMRS